MALTNKILFIYDNNNNNSILNINHSMANMFWKYRMKNVIAFIVH